MTEMIRQGDILLRPISVRDGMAFAADGVNLGKVVDVSGPGEQLVLATGEATGHAHVLSGLTVTAVTADRRHALVHLLEPGGLTHPEHDPEPRPIAPGWREIIRQRVYTPVAPRYVRD